MIWNDIREIREWMDSLTDRLVKIDYTVEKLEDYAEERSDIDDQIKDILIKIDAIHGIACPLKEKKSRKVAKKGVKRQKLD